MPYPTINIPSRGFSLGRPLDLIPGVPQKYQFPSYGPVPSYDHLAKSELRDFAVRQAKYNALGNSMPDFGMSPPNWKMLHHDMTKPLGT